jgi:hypothetical protein
MKLELEVAQRERFWNRETGRVGCPMGREYEIKYMELGQVKIKDGMRGEGSTSVKGFPKSKGLRGNPKRRDR